MVKLVLLRHGESLWNKKNKFTGWTDVDITKKGEEEVKRAAKLLKKEGFTFDIVYTSLLKRAIRTSWILLDEMDLMWIPIKKTWRLNEKHYGILQGEYKHKMAKKVGEEQLQKWRRGYNIKPPELKESDHDYPGNDPKYKHLDKNEIPKSECLKDVIDRFVPYWKNEIVPTIKEDKKVIISGHGNSLRAVVKFLDGICDEEIAKFNIPTGFPLVYELDKDLKPIKKYYLGDPKEIEKEIEGVKKQGKIQ